MNIVDTIFKRTYPDYKKLLNYGFINKATFYSYETIIMDSFKLIVTIDRDANINTKVIDLDTDEEYLNHLKDFYTGPFVSMLRDAYQDVLLDIKDKCFKAKKFIFNQSKRIADYIYSEYNIKPIAFKDSFSYYFKNSTNKWFAVILSTKGDRFNRENEVEVINLKIDDYLLDEYLKINGFFEAYHMNKKHWLSIILDDTVADEVIESILDRSYEINYKTKEWLIPANYYYYDVIAAFHRSDVITWHKRNKIEEGDIVYIYIGEPISAIIFKCEVIESGDKTMLIKKIKRYQNDEYPFYKLKEYGIKAIRGARTITEALSKELNK